EAELASAVDHAHTASADLFFQLIVLEADTGQARSRYLAAQRCQRLDHLLLLVEKGAQFASEVGVEAQPVLGSEGPACVDRLDVGEDCFLQPVFAVGWRGPFGSGGRVHPSGDSLGCNSSWS